MAVFMSMLMLILLLSPILWGLWKLLRHVSMEFSGDTALSVSSSSMLCKSCGSTAGAVKLIRGNLRHELLLWLLGILPGVIYSFWRDNGDLVCSACGSKFLLNSNHQGH